ncbi:MAG: hypothetical protein H7Y04_11145 [Verrucomicrobia bacterium]|nr:hypothetical protein [Cytophagales bacterium]
MRKVLFFWLVLLSCWACMPVFKTNYQTNFVKTQNREHFRQKLRDTLLTAPFRQTNAPDSVWESTFWAMELSITRHDSLIPYFCKLFEEYPHRSSRFQRSFLEMIYALYPVAFEKEIKQTALNEKNEKHFAICMLYLARIYPSEEENLLDLLSQKFPISQNHPILYCLQKQLYQKPDYQLPALKDLLDFHKGHKVIYSFQRPDRNFAGLAVVQQTNGKLVRGKNKQLLVFEQFGRSSSDLPFFITNGNTPQGIFTIADIAPAQNEFIGPTPAFITLLPFEATLDNFFRQKTEEKEWTLKNYLSLFPESWHGYLPIQQAFYAGKAGRNEILAHGTTIDTDFYKNEIFYPFTPSLGCLTGKEIWNPETGRLIQSSQAALLKTFLKTKGKTGFMFVIELADKNEPVSTTEIEELLK